MWRGCSAGRSWRSSVAQVLETPEELADALKAANHLPKERLGSTDDRGFSPFSIDEQPRHGSPDHARDVAFGKIAARVKGTRMASERPGLG
jgi:acyl dehydratase